MAQQMDKQKQKSFLTEIMNDDAKDGLYDTTQTAVEWLMTQLPLGLKITIAEKLEQAEQMEVYQHGLFLHWFIKHYSTETIDGMFGFVDAMGKEVTVKEIVDHYYNETKKIKL